jgi:diguanylate cyclase (GGDEF)-like protein
LTLNLPTVRQLIQKGLSQFRLDSIRRRIPAFAIMGKSSAVRQLVQKALLQFRLDSIHGQIVAFAILAALIPSLVISLIAYAQSHRALTEKITQELMTTGSQAGRETDVWLKERLYDLRVFAASSVVSETVARRGQSGRLVEYLNSVRARVADYEELQLVDADGGLVGSSARGASPVRLPEGWAKVFKSSRSVVGEPYWDEKAQKVIVILGVPVLQASGRISGALVARTNFAELTQVLRGFSARSVGHVYLATARGALIADSRSGPAGRTTRDLAPGVADRLLAAEGKVVEHRGIDGNEVLGSAQRLSQAAWLAVADMPVADAYRQAIRLRNAAFLVIVVLLVFIAVIAYWLAALIARPLRRLTSAAAQVSAGDLPVELPASGGGEVGYLTQVFNTMVASLRKHHDELERLSTTDTLTGLSNRRHLMGLLAHETERAKRAGKPFSILMLDVDHFKKYNDNYGHQAGDEVLSRVGAVLRNSIRPYDCAARYGGEEFLVMLSATSLQRAKESAERIRKQVQAEQFEGGSVTISIGVAEYPSQGDAAESVIGQADAALYEAKRAGRDRVMCASAKRKKAAAS